MSFSRSSNVDEKLTDQKTLTEGTSIADEEGRGDEVGYEEVSLISRLTRKEEEKNELGEGEEKVGDLGVSEDHVGDEERKEMDDERSFVDTEGKISLFSERPEEVEAGEAVGGSGQRDESKITEVGSKMHIEESKSHHGEDRPPQEEEVSRKVSQRKKASEDARQEIHEHVVSPPREEHHLEVKSDVKAPQAEIQEEDHEIFGMGEEEQTERPEEEEVRLEDFSLGEEEMSEYEGAFIVEEEEENEEDAPFDFKLYVERHAEFFKMIRKRKIEVCAEGSDTALVKVELDDLIRGYKAGSERSLARDSTIGLIGICRMREGIEFIDEERIIVRTDYETFKGVRLLTGGHAGIEPLYAGYVGSGMMTAAVIGSDSDAPKVGCILNGIREIYADKGVLIIVQNSPEYRLCFGLAMERARLEGMNNIDMVTVGDDCWEKVTSPVGRRGLAGIALAYKIAGALADSGATLLEIFETIRLLAYSKIATISAITEPNMVIGTGIDRTSSQGIKFNGDLKGLVKEMLSYVLDRKRYFSLRLDPDTPFIVFLNSYRGAQLELGAVLEYALEELASRGLTAQGVYADRFAGGFWPGISITVMLVTDRIMDCLDSPTRCDIWPNRRSTGERNITWFKNQPLFPWRDNTGPTLKPEQEAVVERAVVHASKALYICESLLNAIHVFGNYGTHLKCAAEAVLSTRQRGLLNFKYPFNMLITISNIVQDKIPGFNGAMYGCLFSGAAQSFLRNPLQLVTVASWAVAFEQGLRTLRAYTNSKTGIASLAITLIPVVQKVYSDALKQDPQVDILSNALDKVRKGLEERMKKEERLEGKQALLKNQMDVESYALIIWLEALITSFKGRPKTKRYSQISLLDEYMQRLGADKTSSILSGKDESEEILEDVLRPSRIRDSTVESTTGSIYRSASISDASKRRKSSRKRTSQRKSSDRSNQRRSSDRSTDKSTQRRQTIKSVQRRSTDGSIDPEQKRKKTRESINPRKESEKRKSDYYV